jgi:signal transduction histidine kinase
MDQKTPKLVRVLLVDDDEDDFIIIKKLISQIKDSSFTLDWTSSFDEAILLIESRSHDLYLIDYRLGAQTGLDLLRIVLPQERSEPFILLTGAGDHDIERQSMKLAAADYLVKGTFDTHLLSRTLHYALQRKQMEEQRLAHLVELNRSKDEFISIASHQLRTPATGVKQYIGMLLEGFMGDIMPEQRKMLIKAYESNERQLQIVSDLLKVARVDAGKVMLKKSDVMLNELIGDIIREQHSTYASRSQSIIYQPFDPDINIRVDRDSFRMVLENIIDNASKYSEEGKSVSIEVIRKEKEVDIQVIDHGVGVNPNETGRLFEKFSRINNSLSTKVGGTGLGLYWARKIIDLHDGKITYKPTPNGGSTFIICIPR